MASPADIQGFYLFGVERRFGGFVVNWKVKPH